MLTELVVTVKSCHRSLCTQWDLSVSLGVCCKPEARACSLLLNYCLGCQTCDPQALKMFPLHRLLDLRLLTLS